MFLNIQSNTNYFKRYVKFKDPKNSKSDKPFHANLVRFIPSLLSLVTVATILLALYMQSSAHHKVQLYLI